MRLSGREANAATESGHHERAKNLNLSFSEWISFVISRDHLSRSADRIRLIEHHVSQRHGEIANSRRINYVTIIKDRVNSPFRFINQNVVVIRVVVNDAEAQTTPVDLFPFTKELFDDGLPRARQQAC